MGLPAEKKVERDRALVADRLKLNLSWAKLGMKYDITDRQARRIFSEWAVSNEQGSITDLSGRDPVEIVWESAMKYEQLMEQLAEISTDVDAPDTVKISAISGQMSALEKQLNLLQASGILPKKLGKLRIEADIRYVATTIVQILRDEGVDDSVTRKIMDALSAGASSN